MWPLLNPYRPPLGGEESLGIKKNEGSKIHFTILNSLFDIHDQISVGGRPTGAKKLFYNLIIPAPVGAKAL